MNTSRFALSTVLFVAVFPLVADAGNCYSDGRGPVVTCYEHDREIRVAKPFRYSDGNYYSNDGDGYCYLDKSGHSRCMQDWEVQSLRCSDGEDGRLSCQ